jgi:hypothetical protein
MNCRFAEKFPATDPAIECVKTVISLHSEGFQLKNLSAKRATKNPASYSLTGF